MAQSEAGEGERGRERESQRLSEGHNGKILSLSNLLPVDHTLDSLKLQPEMRGKQKQWESVATAVLALIFIQRVGPTCQTAKKKRKKCIYVYLLSLLHLTSFT